MRRFLLFVCFVGAVAALTTRASDEDKARLFNTFYREGAHISYVLIMRADRSFDLYGPDNGHVAGTFRADEDYVTLSAGGVKRHFKYAFKEHDVRLECRKEDRPVKGDLLGQMPPLKREDSHTLYVCEREWAKKGMPLFKPPSQVAPPVTQVSPPTAPVPPAAPPAVTPPAAPMPVAKASFVDMAGTYMLDVKGTECVVITADGCFGYVTAGASQSGTLLRAGDELTFVGTQHERRFTVKVVPEGLEVTRRQADVVKADDLLGRMSPQDRATVLWVKKAQGGAQAAPSAPVVAPVPAVPPPVATQPVPAPAAPPVETPATPAPTPAAAAAVKDIKSIVGTFVHKPNPFLSETVVIAEDGTFAYRDSNGAKAAGKVAIEDGVLVLTSEGVVRRFTATFDGGTLTLTCAKGDAPELKNDLASMSPTVLKTAQYTKK